jgi:hypothetical protein
MFENLLPGSLGYKIILSADRPMQPLYRTMAIAIIAIFSYLADRPGRL